MDSSGVGGREWPFMEWREEVVVVGGCGRGGGGSMASMSRHVCSLPPSARHKHTHTHEGMQTDTHTGSELLWTSAQSICDTRFLLV